MRITSLPALLITVVLSPAVSLAQNIFIDAPAQGDTLTSQIVTLRMSVSRGFKLGEEGRILIRVDGSKVFETEALRATFTLAPGAHQVEAQLVDMRSRPISSSVPGEVKITIDDRSD